MFWGALLLFFTNLMTIAGTAFVMARIYGFSTRLSEKQTNLQTALIFTVFIALAVPLGLSLVNLARDAADTRQINGAVLGAFGSRALISKLDVELHSEPARVSAVVLTPEVRPDAQQDVQAAIDRILGSKVDLTLTQVPVGNSAQAVQMAQLARASEREAAELAHAKDLADRLALVAGVSPDSVIADRERKIATVNARALDGASLAAYRELESRVAAGEPGWKIRLRPPARPLPAINYDGDKLTEDGAKALALVGWAGQRVGVPIILSGPDDRVDLVAETLSKQGIEVRKESSGQTGPVTASWAAPDQ